MRRTYCPTFHGYIVRFRMLIAGIALALLSMFLAWPALPQTKLIAVGGGSSGGGSGSVTSVNASAVAPLTVSGVPFSTSGTIAIDWTSCFAANVVAAPSGASGKPTCRLLVAADIPELAPSKITGTAVVQARLIATTAPLAGGGDLSADRTLTIAITPANSGGAVALQATTPGTQQTGNVNISGAGVFAGSVQASNLSGTNTGDQTSVTGNAGTATALQANPADCSANQFANAIAASGDLTCAGIVDADVPNTITVDNATTANALAANGTNCGAGNYPLGVDAAGNAEDCTAVSSGSTLPVADTTSIAEGSADGSKEVRFEVDGMTASNTGVISAFGTAAATTLSVTGPFVGSGFVVGTGAGTTSSDSLLRYTTGNPTWGDTFQVLSGDLGGYRKFTASWLHATLGVKLTSQLAGTGASLSADADGTGVAGLLVLNGDDSAPGPIGGGSVRIRGLNGSRDVSALSSELVTLSTGGTTTVSAGNLAVANAEIKAIGYRITTTIGTATDFAIRVTGGNDFCSIGTATVTQSTLTSGTTGVLVPCAADAPFYRSTATTLTITTTGTPSAGVIRVVVYYEQFIPPTS